MYRLISTDSSRDPVLVCSTTCARVPMLVLSDRGPESLETPLPGRVGT